MSVATDPQSLLTAGKCYACPGATVFEIMKLQLLADISLQKNPANDVTPQGLISQGKCFPCFATVSTARIMELALLAQIASS